MRYEAAKTLRMKRPRTGSKGRQYMALELFAKPARCLRRSQFASGPGFWICTKRCYFFTKVATLKPLLFDGWPGFF